MKAEQMTIETVTPLLAKQYLATMVQNRSLSDSRVVDLAITIDNGDWALNGETIKFNGSGQMIDGQHRCEACILSGKSFQTYVARGVTDPRAFATIDTGKARTFGDVFSIAGIKDSNVASGAALLIYYYRKGWITLGGIHPPRTGRFKQMVKGTRFAENSVPKLISKEELLEFAAPFAVDIGNSIRVTRAAGTAKFFSLNMMAAAHFIFAEKSQDSADRFMQDLGAGVALQENDPVFVLREKFISHSGGHSHINRWAALFFTITAWNKRRNGEKSKILKIVEGADFPKAI